MPKILSRRLPTLVFCLTLALAHLALAGCTGPAVALAASLTPAGTQVASDARSLTTGGPVMVVGGGEDQDDLMQMFARLSGGPQAPLVIIPLASGHPEESGKAYVDYLAKLGFPKATSIIPRPTSPNPADLAQLAQARGVFFSGGDQARILDGMSAPWRTVLDRIWHEGAVMAGTSAGSMVWGSTAILDGDPMETAWYGENPAKNGIRLGTGLAFWPQLIIDTHFSERGRVPRLAYAVAKQRRSLGIGVDPQTAAILFPDGHLEVKGRGTVTLLEVPEQSLTVPLSLHGLKVEILSDGDTAPFANRRVRE